MFKTNYLKNNVRRKKILLVLLVLILLVPSVFIFNNAFNERRMSIEVVSGTEYISGESGQVIVRIADRNGNAVRDMDCKATVLYPNKTYFLLDAEMVESSVNGNYYVSFITSDIIGVYEETIICVSADNRTSLVVSSSFHVSLALNLVRQIAENQSTQFEDLTRKLNQTIADLTGLAIQMNETRTQLDTNINETVEKRFRKFYNDTIKSYQAMIDIFSQ